MSSINEKMISDYISGVTIRNLSVSTAVLAAGIVFCFVVRKVRGSLLARVEKDMGGDVRKASVIKKIASAITWLASTMTLLFIMQINGINVGSIIASLGVAGALAGLAWQDMFKDIIQGMNIISGKFFAVGDCVRYCGNDYLVTDFNVRSTKMKSLDTGNILTVCNRNITEIESLSGLVLLNIGLPYETESEKADSVMRECVQEIGKLKGIRGAEYSGLQSFGDSSISYLIKFYCKPTVRYELKRAALRIIRNRLVEAEIDIPYNQLDIHTK